MGSTAAQNGSQFPYSFVYIAHAAKGHLCEDQPTGRYRSSKWLAQPSRQLGGGGQTPSAGLEAAFFNALWEVHMGTCRHATYELIFCATVLLDRLANHSERASRYIYPISLPLESESCRPPPPNRTAALQTPPAAGSLAQL